MAGRLKCCQAPLPEEPLDDEDDPLLDDDDEELDDDEFPLDDEEEPVPEDELLELLLELPLLVLLLLLLLLVLLPLLLLSTTGAAVEPPPPQPAISSIARVSAPYRANFVTKLFPTISQFSARAVVIVFIWSRFSLHVTRVLYLLRVHASHFLECPLDNECRRMQTSSASNRRNELLLTPAQCCAG